MLPLLTHPLALWGLLAVPGLVAIYLLRNRFRRYSVSSLMLWLDPREARAGGTRIRRLQTPLLFFLEVLAVMLLVLAAADPHVPAAQGARPLVVVLDDSFSMLAGGDDSPRARAVRALEEEFRHHFPYSVRLLAGGERPVALGGQVRSAGEALDLLRGWTCRAPTADLDEAVALAAELGGDWGRVLVVTDHAPDPPPAPGRVRWWALGAPRPNLAFVAAARSRRAGGERCLLEVANLARDEQTADLLVETTEPAAVLHRDRVRLNPGQTHRLILTLAEGTPALHAHLGADDLAIDNRVTLLPVPHKPVRCDVRVRDERLQALVDRALGSVRGAERKATRPDLVITDQAEGDAGPAWVVRLLGEKEAVAYTGPFVMDRTHPLTEGLGLQGVLWGAGKEAASSSGTPLIMAGNVVLLADDERPDGRHDVRLRLRPDLSTLQNTPAWPVLWWNLVQWRAALASGLSRANVRLGEAVVLTLAEGQGDVRLIGPTGRARPMAARDGRVVVRADDVGVFTLRAGEKSHPFAVNALSRDESDLTGCGAGRWGDEADETTLRLEYQSISWVLLLLLLAVASLHLFLIARERGRVGP